MLDGALAWPLAQPSGDPPSGKDVHINHNKIIEQIRELL